MCHLAVSSLLSHQLTILIDKYYFRIFNHHVSPKLIYEKKLETLIFFPGTSLDKGPRMCHYKLVSSTLVNDCQSINPDVQLIQASLLNIVSFS